VPAIHTGSRWKIHEDNDSHSHTAVTVKRLYIDSYTSPFICTRTM